MSDDVYLFFVLRRELHARHENRQTSKLLFANDCLRLIGRQINYYLRVIVCDQFQRYRRGERQE